jgi:glutamate/aspartate transport system substrate-binding protein
MKTCARIKNQTTVPMTVATIVLIVMQSMAFAQSTATDTLSKIRKSGVVVVGHRTSSIPFSYLPGANSTPMGYSISICERVVDALRASLRLPGLRIQYQPVSPENRVSLVTNHRIDMECGSTTDTEAMRKDVDFSATIFAAATRVVVSRSAHIKSMRDLNGRKVAVTHGTVNEQVLEQFSRNHKLAIELVRGHDHDGSFSTLRLGTADAVAMDDVLLIGLINDSGGQGRYEFLDETLSSEAYGIMIRKDDPAFKKVVDRTINEMIDQGALAKLYMQWFRSPIPPKRVNLGLPFTEEMAKVLRLLPR